MTPRRSARRWRGVAWSITFLLAALLPRPAASQSSNEQVSLASEGRYDKLVEKLEASAATRTFGTADQHALCFAYSVLKNYAKLFTCLDKLQKLADAGDQSTLLFGLDDVRPAIHIMRAEALIDFARYDEAGVSASQAVDLLRRTHSDAHDLQANALAALAVAAALGGHRDAAAGYVQQLEKVDVSWPRYNAYANAKAYALARSDLALGRYQETLQALAQNKSFAVQVFLDNLLSGATFRGASNWTWQELPRAYMAAKSLKELGRRGDAKEAYDRLLSIDQIQVNGEINWLILYDRGRIAEDENNVDEAIGLYARSIDVFEVQRASINTESNKIGFVGNKKEVYDHIVGLLINSGRSGEALEYVERSKSRALVDLLAGRLTDPGFVEPGPASTSALDSFLKADTAARLQVPIAEGGGLERRRSIVVAADQLRKVAPEIASLVTVDRIRLNKMQALLTGDETLLEYHLAGAASYAFVVTRDAVTGFSLQLAGLDDTLRQFRQSVDAHDADALRLSRTLHGQLIEPLASRLTTHNLLIVPDGALHYLSFAALNDGRQFMIDRFALRNVPSVSALEFVKGRATPAGTPILIFGNPQRDLPDAQREAEALARLVPGSKLLVNEEATKSSFLALAGKYRLIHVALHGSLVADRPLASALLFASDGGSSGRLTVEELYRMKLDADLMTLSACKTGFGVAGNGSDVIGLSRAALLAGANSIVASLWEVPDQATSYLMQSFYRHLSTSDKREALRVAQTETKQRYPHPYFWAGFYLIGSAK